jgi:Group II intron, maturase-specific domain
MGTSGSEGGPGKRAGSNPATAPRLDPYFNLRRYPNGKLLIKPGATAIKRFRKRLAEEFRALRGTNAEAVLATIVPITRGWSAYYKTAVSTRAFNALDAHLWKLTYKWACWTHPNKPKHWITNRYYRRFSKFRTDRWVFGNPGTGAFLPKLSWTPIVRHTLVKGGASPDDPSLAAYWARRRQKVKPPLDPSVVRLLSRQDGRCSRCGETCSHPTSHPSPPRAGNAGSCRSSRWRSRRTTWPSAASQPPGTIPGPTSYTPPAAVACNLSGGGPAPACQCSAPEPPVWLAWAVCGDDPHARS